MLKGVVALLLLGLVSLQANHAAGLAQQQQPTEQGDFCQGCRAIVSFAGIFNESSSRVQSKQVIAAFCEIYYPTSTDFQDGACPDFVEGLFFVLDRIDPINHCDQIGACGPVKPVSRIRTNQISPYAGDENVLCDSCERVVDRVKRQLLDPEVIKAVRQKVDAFCNFLRVVDQDEQCHQVSRKYLDQLVAFIRNVNPQQYCQSLRLCNSPPNPPSVVGDAELAPRPSLLDFSDFGIETSVELGNRVVKDITREPQQSPDRSAATLTPLPQRAPSPSCRLCKGFVDEMFHFLKDNRTEASIRVALDKVCTLIYKPGPNRDNCDELVETYSRELVELLADETDPEMICILLNQCASQFVPYKVVQEEPAAAGEIAVASETAESVPQTQAQTEAGGERRISLSEFISMLDPSIDALDSMRTCVECKLFINYIKDSMEDPKNEEEAKQWLLKNLCETLENKEQNESCRRLVGQYTELFFRAVSEDLDAQQTCQQLGACRPRSLVKVLVLDQAKPSSPSPAAPAVAAGNSSSSSSSSLCDNCVQIMTQIDDYISTHQSDDTQEIIDKVCKKINDEAMASKCTQLMENFGELIVSSIMSMGSPREVCQKLYIC